MNEVKRLNIAGKHFQEINKNENGVTSKPTLILPYADEKGFSIVRPPEKQLKRSGSIIFNCSYINGGILYLFFLYLKFTIQELYSCVWLQKENILTHI